MAVRMLIGTMVALLVGCGIASAQDQGPQAMKKLTFLAGSWNCVIRGGPSNGVRDHLVYEFSPDYLWMIERSNVTEGGQTNWSAQIWGYDAARSSLVAYQFSSGGVSSKTVEGWIDGRFVSKRDDNGSTVSAKPIDAHTFDWVIESADGSHVVTEHCSR